jgi:hypothetical protein
MQGCTLHVFFDKIVMGGIALNINSFFAKSKTGIPGIWESRGVDPQFNKRFSIVICDNNGNKKPFLTTRNKPGRESYKQALVPVEPGDFVIAATYYKNPAMFYVYVKKVTSVEPLHTSTYYYNENLEWDQEPPDSLKEAVQTATNKVFGEPEMFAYGKFKLK